MRQAQRQAEAARADGSARAEHRGAAQSTSSKLAVDAAVVNGDIGREDLPTTRACTVEMRSLTSPTFALAVTRTSSAFAAANATAWLAAPLSSSCLLYPYP